MIVHVERGIERWASRDYPGMHVPPNTQAAGEAILSGLSEEAVDEVVARRGLDRYTEQTIIDRDELADAVGQTQNVIGIDHRGRS